MRNRLYARLLAAARRHVGSGLAEDVVQDALLVAVEAGRMDLDDPETARWLGGVVRNRARMAGRSASRSRQRNHNWQTSRDEPPTGQGASLAETLHGLPPALRVFAALVLTGHNRREIAYLLNLPDTALRQRVSALKAHLVAKVWLRQRN